MTRPVFDILDEEIVHSRDASIAKLTVWLDGREVEVTGTSRRHPSDAPNRNVATLIATGRAYQALASKLLRRAQGMVDHADNILQIRPLQAERRKEWEARQRQTQPRPEPISNLRSIQDYKNSRTMDQTDS